MLKLKLQYFGHLMQRADSFEKILTLGKTEGGIGVQPQQDPGVPSGWTALARERERYGETKLRWSRSVTLFLKGGFIPWVAHRGEWKMQPCRISSSDPY